MVFYLVLTIAISIIIGFGFGRLSNNVCKPEGNQDVGKWKVDMDKLHVWDVVRYRNGDFDCVWSGNHTKIGAEKLCEKLNNDYHKNYGEYRVENSTYTKV